MNEKLVDQLYTLIRSASTDLPADVEGALREAETKEPAGSTAGNTFGNILQNVKMAREAATPICQDTGALVMYVHHPVGTDTVAFRNAVEAAAQRATKDVLLRPNAVDPVTGKNTGNNIGVNAPYISFKQWDKDEIHVKLMLKGGGSENVGAQYKLPDGKLGAGRDLEGVRRAVLDAVVDAQGKGCAPGVLGVCVGGDRVSAFEESKRQLLRPLKDSNPVPELAELERRVDGRRRELRNQILAERGAAAAPAK